MRFALLTATVLAGVALLSPQAAHAAACLTSDVSLTINGTTFHPSNCADDVNQGGGPLTETASLDSKLNATGVFLASSDPNDHTAGVLGGIAFSVTASGGNAGSWHVVWTDVAGLPNLPFVINLEVGDFGGNNGAGYMFPDLLLPISPNNGTGTYDINFTAGHSQQQPALSHIILAGSAGTAYVPEPTTLALLGTGLLGLGIIRRRRR